MKNSGIIDWKEDVVLLRINLLIYIQGVLKQFAEYFNIYKSDEISAFNFFNTIRSQNQNILK